jgi:hypothetical protein
MVMKFEALRARYGDSLFLTFPRQNERPLRLLVDGGPGNVFQTSIRERLDQEQRAFPAEKPLMLDAVMISHVDEDHILGILDMFEALQDAEERRAPWPWKPRWLLHNSLDSLLGEGDGGAARAIGGTTVLASLGTVGPLALPDNREPDHVAQFVLASYGQGSRLSSKAAALKITRNPPDQSVIMTNQEDPRILQIGDARLTVLGPRQAQVDRLRTEWAKWKLAHDKKHEATQSLATTLDTSIPNLSSIVCLVEQGGKRVLITGDARGDHIIKTMEEGGLMPARTGTYHVDILKLPHHGSIRNAPRNFFTRITADHYVASGDGTYGNPDRATLLEIEKARPEGGYTVHLTYDAASCDVTHKAWLAARSNPPFKDGRDSIADVIARWRAEGKIAVKEGTVSIDL